MPGVFSFPGFALPVEPAAEVAPKPWLDGVEIVDFQSAGLLAELPEILDVKPQKKRLASGQNIKSIDDLGPERQNVDRRTGP